MERLLRGQVVQTDGNVGGLDQNVIAGRRIRVVMEHYWEDERMMIARCLSPWLKLKMERA
jgi:hypothetical protein